MSNVTKHRVFISYHHANDQAYKNELCRLNDLYDVFIDASVDTGDIDDDLSDERIRQKIRDEYLKNSTVTILLVGTETKGRKHVDWELYSSMYNGAVNKQSGILVVNLPTIYCEHFTATHPKEKETVYPEVTSWVSITESEYQERYPYMPDRIIDNLANPKADISVTPWSKLETDIENLRFLIDATFKDKDDCEYDLSRPMRRRNS